MKKGYFNPYVQNVLASNDLLTGIGKGFIEVQLLQPREKHNQEQLNRAIAVSINGSWNRISFDHLIIQLGKLNSSQYLESSLYISFAVVLISLGLISDDKMNATLQVFTKLVAFAI